MCAKEGPDLLGLGIGMASVASLVAQLTKIYNECEHELKAIERVCLSIRTVWCDAYHEDAGADSVGMSGA